MNTLYIVARNGTAIDEIKDVETVADAFEAGRMWLSKNPDFKEETKVFPVATLPGYGFYYYVEAA